MKQILAKLVSHPKDSNKKPAWKQIYEAKSKHPHGRLNSNI